MCAPGPGSESAAAARPAVDGCGPVEGRPVTEISALEDVSPLTVPRPDHGSAITVLTVTIAGRRCALPIGCVAEVVAAARIEKLPGAPDTVMGLLDLRSDVFAVIDGRRCLGHEGAPLRVTDRFVVLRLADQRRALRVDAVDDVIEIPDADVTEVAAVMPDVVRACGVARRADGLLVVLEPSRLLSVSDATGLRRALADLESEASR